MFAFLNIRKYVDIREFAKRRVKLHYISTSILKKYFVYFIIHIYIIISSIVSPIFVILISYIIAPIYVMSVYF